jgi:hypothetical protein
MANETDKTSIDDLRFDPANSDPQPGIIENRERYEAGIHSGKIGEIPERNVVFVGKGDAPTSIHGAFKADLPDSDTQKRGFYHEKAREIIAHFPKMYKKFARKGDK